MIKVKSQFRRLLSKRTVKTLLIGFLFYCLVTIVAHYFSFMHPPSARAFGSEEFRDLTVALWANLVFAGTFGILAAILSLFRPEEDSLDKRLGYLYPRSSTLSGEARSRLGKNAMKLAAPAVAGELLFVVERYDQEKSAFWLDVYISFTLRNILQDEPYEDEIEILVCPDVVPGATELGRLHESSVLCPDAQPARVVHAVARPITVATKRFQEFVKVVIPPKAEAIHSYHFSSWGLAGEPWVFHAQRYTENIKVRLANRSGAQITFKLSKGTNNPTVTAEPLASRKVVDGEELTLKDNLVLDGNRDNLQLVLTM